MSQASTVLKVAIAGAGGRMGQLLVDRALKDSELFLCGVSASPQGVSALEESLRRRVGAETVIADEPRAAFTNAEVVIDFSIKAAVEENARAARDSGVAYLVGVTNLDTKVRAVFADAAREVPVLAAANMSLGVATLAHLVRQAAQLLDLSWDVEILEMHHRNKEDAPSGTAKMLASTVACGPHARHAQKNAERSGVRAPGEIGFAALRGGTVAGEHEVVFAGEGERLILAHKAQDRSLFVNGAIVAARWLARQPPGQYTIEDVLGAAEA